MLEFLRNNLQTIIWCLIVIITALFFIIARGIAMSKVSDESLSLDERENALDLKAERKRGWYERTILFMSQNGVNYRMKKIVKPNEWRSYKIIGGLIGGLVGMLLGVVITGPFLTILITAVLFVFGYYVVDLNYIAQNNSDNKKMLHDIKTMYDTLRVFTAVDLYITSALDECYRRVGNKRLKTALYELNEGLKNQSNHQYEIESFAFKFKNPYITQFANALSQYYASGNINTMMTDLSEQMVALDRAINIQTKEKLDTRNTVKHILVMVGLMAAIAVSLLSNLSDLMSSMW